MYTGRRERGGGGGDWRKSGKIWNSRKMREGISEDEVEAGTNSGILNLAPLEIKGSPRFMLHSKEKIKKNLLTQYIITTAINYHNLSVPDLQCTFRTNKNFITHQHFNICSTSLSHSEDQYRKLSCP